jgi:hypothetical protein
MGWQIKCLVNGLVIPINTAQEIEERAKKEKWPVDYEPVNWYRGQAYLRFDSDRQEHMDFLWQTDIQKFLLKGGCRGQVCFGSLDGDNSGEFWGYSFTDGGVKNMVGCLEWDEEE